MNFDNVEGLSITFGNDVSGIILGIVFFLIGYILYFRKKQYTIYKLGVLLTLFIYITMVIGVTLTPFPLNFAEIKNLQWLHESSNYLNLIPFKEIFSYLHQCVLNVIMFIPFGILYPLYKGKINIKYAIVSSTIFTVLIEMLQLTFSIIFQAPAWFFDINDIMANVLGGIIGYIILKAIVKPIILNVLHIEI